MEVEETIIDKIELKRMLWFGHLMKMGNKWWLKTVLQRLPMDKTKIGIRVFSVWCILVNFRSGEAE